jgi:hypothetical protein
MLIRGADGFFVRATRRGETSPFEGDPGRGVGIPGRVEEEQVMTTTLSKIARGDRALNAIRAKYKTPAAVLDRLGIDQSLLEDPTMATAAEVLAMIDKAMKALSPEEQSALCEGMFQMLENTDSVRAPANSAAEDARRRRLAADSRPTSRDSFARRHPNTQRITVMG